METSADGADDNQGVPWTEGQAKWPADVCSAI